MPKEFDDGTILLQKFLDESLDEEETDRFLERLTADRRAGAPQNLRLTESLWIHRLLEHFYEGEKKQYPLIFLGEESREPSASEPNCFDQAALEAVRMLEATPQTIRPSAPSVSQGKNSWRYHAFLASTILLFLALGLWSEFGAKPPGSKENIAFRPIAEVTASAGARWPERVPSIKTGQQFETLRVRLDEGILQFRLNNGVRLALEGPIDLRLPQTDKVFLNSGKLSVFVPPEAVGFAVTTPMMTIVDHGTEFFVTVSDDGVETHTISGLTELTEFGRDHLDLPQGQAARIDAAGKPKTFEADPQSFLTEYQVNERVVEEEIRRLALWRSTAAKWNDDPALLVRFDFEDTNNFVQNRAARGRPDVGGGRMTGTRRSTGRIAGKQALSFRGGRDAVALDMPKKIQNLTLIASLKIDSLDHFANCLLASEELGAGRIYWQLTQDGSLVLAVQGAENRTLKYASPPILPKTSWGAWYLLTTVIDSGGKTVTHYLDGKPVAVLSMDEAFGIEIGEATLGNGIWKGGAVADRSFRGSIDEFMLFDRALSEQEISSLVF